LALRPQSRSCFLPSRTSVAGRAQKALLRSLEAASNEAIAGSGSLALGTGAQGIKLYLHPRDARLLGFKPLPLVGVERVNALKSQLEGSLLEDLDRLVLACRFERDQWYAALSDKSWIEALAIEARSLGLKLEGVWPAQCLFDVAEIAQTDKPSEAWEHSNLDLLWPPARGQVEASTRIRQWPDKALKKHEQGLNLLEALVLGDEKNAWAATSADSVGIGRRFALLVAQVRWALSHSPKGSLRRPMTLGLACMAVAGIGLQIDTWTLQSRVEEAEAELGRLFKETMPNQTVMVDPVLQLQRALDQRRQSPFVGSGQATDMDPIAGMLLMQRALSRAAGASAADAVQMIEWRTGPSGAILSLRYNASAVDQQSLRPIVQDLASKAGWSVQWGAAQEGLMQWQARSRQGYGS
jgi:hypothetical protein